VSLWCRGSVKPFLGGSQKGFSRLRMAFPKPSALLDFVISGSLPKFRVVPDSQSVLVKYDISALKNLKHLQCDSGADQSHRLKTGQCSYWLTSEATSAVLSGVLWAAVLVLSGVSGLVGGLLDVSYNRAGTTSLPGKNAFVRLYACLP